MEARSTKHEARKESCFGFRISDFGFPCQRGYTLIELIVAVGLFALIMTLASGAYFIVINLGRQVQGVSTGINNLSFALETMTRNIRTGTDYDCGNSGDCPNGSSSFSFKNADGEPISYGLSGSSIQETKNGITSILTDPSVSISSLNFYAIGTENTDAEQPRATIIVSGNVAYGAGKTEQFSVETGATMRGPDIFGSSGASPLEPPPVSIIEGKYDDNSPGNNGQFYAWNYADPENIMNSNSAQLYDGNVDSGGVSGNDRMIAIKLNQSLPAATNFTIYGNWGSRLSAGYSSNGTSWTTVYYGTASPPHTFIVPAGALYVAGSIEQGGRSIFEIANRSQSGGSCGNGGLLAEVSGDCVHTFTANGTFTPPGSVSSVKVLVVGGGGGGGNDGSHFGGGGGAGGYRYNASLAVSSQTYTVTVGRGGSINANGDDSIFSTITAIGGGKGGGTNNGSGGDGGSGGGGEEGSVSGSGTNGQGNDGGDATNGGNSGGGGGGIGSVGGNGGSSTTGGSGGSGITNSISGLSVVYAGGGGGSGRTSSGIGGSGIGGDGAVYSGNNSRDATAGTANTGSGGGGGVAGRSAGAGGSGIVIIRYAKP